VRLLWRLVRRLVLLALVLVVALMVPVAYVETMCRGSGTPAPYAAILPEADRRPEARTLLTYPEWHIVHAYEDYAAVIATGDPHDFGYVGSVRGFWSSLCSLSRVAPLYGGADGATKQMVYTIGVSFTAELLLKAAYEETLGRAFALARGAARAPLDDLSATQAAAYATFLQQVPWYRWDFAADAAALRAAGSGALRDRERRMALGIEYGVKAAYARLIAAAVAGVGADRLTMRSVVAGLSLTELTDIDGVTIIADRPEGTEIETPRYRAFTAIARAVAAKGGDFVEIAGNDDILFTAVTEETWLADALASVPLQGRTGTRHLLLVKVADLARRLRSGLPVEHVHDY
jgi:hypothetical protein